MAELKNCERCGDVFASTAGQTVCPACHRKEEQDFQKVYRFMARRKNREATIEEIVKATDVEEDLIIKFMKQNRLRASQFPNLSYACEKCGKSITEGRLCQTCSSSLQSALKKQEEIELIEERNAQRQDEAHQIYYTMNKKKE